MLPHRRQSRQIGRLPQCFAFRRRQSVEQRDEGRNIVPLAQPQEYPIAFLAPFHKASFGQDTDMARHARLALPHDLRNLPHGQLHRAQQVDDAQPRRVAKCPENIECRVHGGII